MVRHNQWAVHGPWRRKRALGQKEDGRGGWHLIGTQHGFWGWRSRSLSLPRARVCPARPLQHTPPSQSSRGRFAFQSRQLSMLRWVFVSIKYIRASSDMLTDPGTMDYTVMSEFKSCLSNEMLSCPVLFFYPPPVIWKLLVLPADHNCLW